jgi:hypothetical protein
MIFAICELGTETLVTKEQTVPDLGKGVCADPLNGDAILGKGGRIPEAGTGSVSWTLIRKEGRRDKMRRRQEVKEDDPFTASRCQHA